MKSMNLDFETDKILTACKADLNPLTQLITVAFQNYPQWQYFFPDEGKRQKKMFYPIKTILSYALRYGKIYYLPGYKGVFVGFTSESYPFKYCRLIRTGGLRTLRSGLKFIRKATKIDKRMKISHSIVISEPHLYLYILAIHPDYQNQKLGSSIIHTVLDFCDRHQYTGYFETHSLANVELYLHYGFEVKDHFGFPGTEIQHWGMIRIPGNKPF